MRGTMRFAATLLAASGWVAASGCVAIEEQERTFLSNREILDRIAQEAQYVVAPELYELNWAELAIDSLTFQYRGRAHPGDVAWVVRFAPKSTEQDPEALADVFALLPIVREGREGFRVIDDDAREIEGLKLRYIRYAFESPARDADGQPLGGLGVVATVSGTLWGEPIVFHMKLDNYGDRSSVDWEDLRPFLEPLLGVVET